MFVVGAPRSGTTWLQAVLSTDPRVVTYPETALFRTLASLDGAFDRSPEALIGVQHLVTEQQFDEWRLGLWELGRANLLAAAPDARIILDKTPIHVHYIPMIRRAAPTARFIHLVRHPLAVVRSLLETSRTYGNRWAPGRVDLAARSWTRSIDDGSARNGPDLITVRFEDLTEGRSTPAGRAAWDAVTRHAHLDDFALPDLALPPGELGRAISLESGTWRPSPLGRMRGHSSDDRDRPPLRLRPFEQRIAWAACGARATRLGYGPAGDTRPPRPLDRLRLHRGALVDHATRAAQRLWPSGGEP